MQSLCTLESRTLLRVILLTQTTICQYGCQSARVGEGTAMWTRLWRGFLAPICKIYLRYLSRVNALVYYCNFFNVIVDATLYVMFILIIQINNYCNLVIVLIINISHFTSSHTSDLGCRSGCMIYTVSQTSRQPALKLCLSFLLRHLQLIVLQTIMPHHQMVLITLTSKQVECLHSSSHIIFRVVLYRQCASPGETILQ